MKSYYYFFALLFSLGAGMTAMAQPSGTSVCNEFFTGQAKGLCRAYCVFTGCGTDHPIADPKACSSLLSNFTRAGLDQDVTNEEFNYATCTPAVSCHCGPLLNTADASFESLINGTNTKMVGASNPNCPLGSNLSVGLASGDVYRCDSAGTGLDCLRWSQNQSGLTKEQANACVNVLRQVSGFPFTPFP